MVGPATCLHSHFVEAMGGNRAGLCAAAADRPVGHNRVNDLRQLVDIYIWAVLNNFVLETSLGFFITPLMTVLLGVAALRERLRRPQAIAVILATIGVVALAVGQGGTLWIALVLAATFSIAGLIRKVTPLDPLCGLLIETMLMAPIAIAWLWWGMVRGQALFSADTGENLLLLMTGVVTAVPLLLFSAAAKKMPYSLAGQFQYIGPTLQFLQAVLLFHEPFGSLHLFTFICIWTGLGIFAIDLLRSGGKWATAGRTSVSSGK
jgi:chloramphenicol-sensitive protein RarD